MCEDWQVSPCRFYQASKQSPHFSKSRGQTLPVESSKAMELGAISKIVISASSAPISGGVHTEGPFGALGCSSGVCSRGFGLVGTGDESPALGIWPQQSGCDHTQTCTVAMASAL